MADRKIIEEYKLSEAINRLKQINEYTFITSAPLTEEGDDENQPQQSNDNGGNVQPPSADGNGQQTVSPDGGNQQSPQQPPMDSAQAGQMPQDAQTLQQNDNVDITDGQQQMPIDAAVPPVQTTDGADEMQSDDEVIDVDDLTDAQEDTEEKVDGVSHQLLRLFKVVSKYNDAIDRQNQEIEELKKEFEKRNPTEEEQLNIRSQAGYPYSEQPKDYWENKVKENPNYNVIFDNNVSTDKEPEKFEIKDSDLNGINYKNVSDSFDDDDDMKLTDFLSL